MACKVFVGSLPLGTKPKELRHLFQNFGVVVECDVKNRCGFIHMETPVMAETAILALNGSDFKGQLLNVEPGRSKEMPQRMGQMPPNNMICDSGKQGDSEQHSMNSLMFQGGGNRGFRRGGGPSNRGGPQTRGGGSFNRVGGPPNRSGGPQSRGGGPQNHDGLEGNPFNSNRGGHQNRGGGAMGNRGGGSNTGRGFSNNRNQGDSGPMRYAPSFKQRPGPYPALNGGPQNEGGAPVRGGKFGGARGGFNGPPNRNQNTQQRNNNWGNQNIGGGPPQHGGNFENTNAMGGSYGGGNMRNPNANSSFGQDRRGFTLDDAQAPMSSHQKHQRQPPFSGNRATGERNNFHGTDGESAAFGSPNMSGGPPHRGRGGGRGNFGPGRGGGRGNFGGGRGGGPGHFGPPQNNYNQEFPALQPARGRGGFSGSNRGGNRGGFNRNAPNMMSNRRQ